MSSDAQLEERLKKLEERLEQLQAEAEQAHKKVTAMLPAVYTENEQRVVKAAQELGLSKSKMKRVPEHYYTLSLHERRVLLGAPSVHHLCKSIILENTMCTRNDCSDPKNSRFYCVIIQYTTRLMSHKLFTYLREVTNKTIPKKNYHFNLAKSSDNDRLTGYLHNGVSPLGMTEKVPIVLSKRILDLSPGFIWLGGGEKDVKLGLDVQEFIEKCSPFIADITHEGFDYNVPREDQDEPVDNTETNDD